jgi:hypothetical protein
MQGKPMPAIDRSKVWSVHKGKWVAFKEDMETVITSGVTLKQTRKKATELGYPHPIFEKMPRDLTYFVG